MIGLLTVGAITLVFLLGVFILSLRKPAKVTLEERIYLRKTNIDLYNKGKADNLGILEKIELKLAQSGLGISLSVFAVIGLVAAACVYFVIIYLVDAQFAALIGSLVVGVFLPKQVLLYLIDRKRRDFDLAFSKALKRMSATMRSGGTLLESVKGVADSESLPQIIRKEMAIVLVDYEYGDSLDIAFEHMYDRTGLEDVKSVAMSIEIGLRQGTKLYEIFDNYVNTIMDRKEIEAEGRATLAETKVTTNTLVTVPFLFAIFVKYHQPSYFDNAFAYKEGLGKYIFFGIYAVVIFGFVYLRKKIDIRI